MSTEVIESLGRMADLRDDWDALAGRQRCPLQDFDWYFSCAETLHQDDQLHIIVLRDASGATLAIAPLVLNGNGRLEFLGASYLFEPADMIYRDDRSLRSLYEAISRSRYAATLSRLRCETAEVCLTAGRDIKSGYWLSVSSAGTPVLDLSLQWEDYYDSLSQRRRYDHRRATRRAGAIGPVTFERHRPNRNEVSALIETAYDVENRSWKGRNGSSLRKNPRLAAFFRRYAERAADENNLRLFFQEIGDCTAAVAICVEKYGALWFLKIGYDEKYGKCSPGLLLLMNIVRHCCDTGVSRIEHLGSPELWLDTWTSFVRPHMTLAHYPLSFAGIRALGTDSVGRVASLISRTTNEARKRRQ